jgi:hypothetical protein
MQSSRRPDRRGITVLALVILIIVAVLLVIFLIRYLDSPAASAQLPTVASPTASTV